jgi:hypothetical protein
VSFVVCLTLSLVRTGIILSTARFGTRPRPLPGFSAGGASLRISGSGFEGHAARATSPLHGDVQIFHVHGVASPM